LPPGSRRRETWMGRGERASRNATRPREGGSDAGMRAIAQTRHARAGPAAQTVRGAPRQNAGCEGFARRSGRQAGEPAVLPARRAPGSPPTVSQRCVCYLTPWTPTISIVDAENADERSYGLIHKCSEISMLNYLKTYIKARPRFYDFINHWRPISGDLPRWLDSFSRRNLGPVKFIQVGANDGLRWDPLRRFILRDDWEGVFVEPIPPVYDLLRKNYAYLKRQKLYFENTAISNQSGEIEFWSYSRNFLRTLDIEKQLYYLRKSSLSREVVKKSLADFSDIEDKIHCYKVPSTQVARIIDKYFQVDLVFIDAEGFDDDLHSAHLEGSSGGFRDCVSAVSRLCYAIRSGWLSPLRAPLGSAFP